MVRNIDLPEAVILCGLDVVGNPARDGLVELLKECKEIETATILLHDDPTTTKSPALPVEITELCSHTMVAQTTSSERTFLNSLQDFLNILDTVTVKPRPFGGSSGFGAQPAEPVRALMAARCVVLSGCLSDTRAARAAGMRVISFDTDDPFLADAVVSDSVVDFWVDDIATPGSFWLNPPHPRNDQGNAVDPYEMVMVATSDQQQLEKSETLDGDAPMDEDDLNAILADLAPLK